MDLSAKRLISCFLIVSPLLLPASSLAQSTLRQCPQDQSQHYDNCFGTYTHENIGEYVGEFRDNQYSGQGTYTFIDGRKYVGEFRNNEYNGFGTYTTADGDRYVGQWKDNKYSGQGDYTFADGRQYVGQFRDSEYNGQGTYTFVDGRKFVGEFRDNKYNGLGTFYAADGSVLEHGIYENDVLVKAVSQQPELLSPSKPEISPGPSQEFPEESQLRQD